MPATNKKQPNKLIIIRQDTLCTSAIFNGENTANKIIINPTVINATLAFFIMTPPHKFQVSFFMPILYHSYIGSTMKI